jgi:hypothetical protein
MIKYIDAPEYAPGACNIGPAEIARRRLAGILGMGASVALGAFLLAVDAPPATRLLVGIPVAGGLVGFIQARSRFCANYGLRGVRNMGAIGEAERVEDAAARAADRKRALRIVGASAVGGLAAGIAFALLPF